jgi:ssDNA-binding Zn-finger/Zn-ribbon topoisomerase 1
MVTIEMSEELATRLSAVLEELSHAVRNGAPYVDVKCPACNEVMEHRTGQYGPFLGCPNYPNCTYLVSLDENGRPKGVPADQVTRTARKEAHKSFDRLWDGQNVNGDIFPSRSAAYDWLKTMGGKTHIQDMNEAECAELTDRVNSKLQRQGDLPIKQPKARAYKEEDDVPF